jgi:hypothetical protein
MQDYSFAYNSWSGRDGGMQSRFYCEESGQVRASSLIIIPGLFIYVTSDISVSMRRKENGVDVTVFTD